MWNFLKRTGKKMIENKPASLPATDTTPAQERSAIGSQMSPKQLCENAIAYLKPTFDNEQLSNSETVVKATTTIGPILEDIGNGLVLTYVVDMGSFFLFLDRENLNNAGLSEVWLREKAIDNLLAIAERKLEVKPHNGAYFVAMGGNFEASLLTADSFWDQSVAHLTPNGAVVAIPGRDLLAFCDAQSSEGISELDAMLGRVKKAKIDHPLITTILQRAGKTWRPFTR